MQLTCGLHGVLIFLQLEPATPNVKRIFNSRDKYALTGRRWPHQTGTNNWRKIGPGTCGICLIVLEKPHKSIWICPRCHEIVHYWRHKNNLLRLFVAVQGSDYPQVFCVSGTLAFAACGSLVEWPYQIEISNVCDFRRYSTENVMKMAYSSSFGRAAKMYETACLKNGDIYNGDCSAKTDDGDDINAD